MVAQGVGVEGRAGDEVTEGDRRQRVRQRVLESKNSDLFKSDHLQADILKQHR